MQHCPPRHVASCVYCGGANRKCNFETSPNFPHKTAKTTFHFLNSDPREIFPGVTIPSFPPTSRSVMCTFGNFLPEGARLARSREGACACACMMGIRFRRSLSRREDDVTNCHCASPLLTLTHSLRSAPPMAIPSALTVLHRTSMRVCVCEASTREFREAHCKTE